MLLPHFKTKKKSIFLKFFHNTTFDKKLSKQYSALKSKKVKVCLFTNSTQKKCDTKIMLPEFEQLTIKIK